MWLRSPNRKKFGRRVTRRVTWAPCTTSAAPTSRSCRHSPKNRSVALILTQIFIEFFSYCSRRSKSWWRWLRCWASTSRSTWRWSDRCFCFPSLSLSLFAFIYIFCDSRFTARRTKQKNSSLRDFVSNVDLDESLSCLNSTLSLCMIRFGCRQNVHLDVYSK